MNELRMRSQTPAKSEALLELARLRQATRLDDHYCIGDFHDGIYECDHVSPYTKSGYNINADVMIVAQDWTSADSFSGAQPDRGSVEFTQGYTPSLSTNRNLDGESRKVWGIRHARLLVPSQIKHNYPTLCGTLHLQVIVGKLRDCRAHLVATEQPVDTSSATGKAFFDMLGVFAEFETNLRRERQAEGIAAAKQRAWVICDYLTTVAVSRLHMPGRAVPRLPPGDFKRIVTRVHRELPRPYG